MNVSQVTRTIDGVVITMMVRSEVLELLPEWKDPVKEEPQVFMGRQLVKVLPLTVVNPDGGCWEMEDEPKYIGHLGYEIGS